jgi:THUMP domain-like/RNA cap guanine-N2 methyltransferase
VITPEDLEFLQGAEAGARLGEIASRELAPEAQLGLLWRLRQQFGPQRGRALLETALLRIRAASKFTRAGEMFFIKEALQQASSQIVSSWRARRFKEYDVVADLCCGIGGDAVSLIAASRVIGIERDQLRLAMAEANLRVYEAGDRFQGMLGDVSEMEPHKIEAGALFIDPSRRQGARKVVKPQEYCPPLSVLEPWRKSIPAACVKVAPGVSWSDLPPDAEVEYISVGGEMREAVLWFADLRRDGALRRATVLPAGQSMTCAHESDQYIPATEPGDYLLEPDVAVVRARMVGQLAAELGAAPLDTSTSYLTADKPISTPFASCFKVEAVLPLNFRKLKTHLRQEKISSVEMHNRGMELDAPALAKKLKGSGNRRVALFALKKEGRAIAILAQRSAENRSK